MCKILCCRASKPVATATTNIILRDKPLKFDMYDNSRKSCCSATKLLAGVGIFGGLSALAYQFKDEIVSRLPEKVVARLPSIEPAEKYVGEVVAAVRNHDYTPYINATREFLEQPIHISALKEGAIATRGQAALYIGAAITVFVVGKCLANCLCPVKKKQLKVPETSSVMGTQLLKKTQKTKTP